MKTAFHGLGQCLATFETDAASSDRGKVCIVIAQVNDQIDFSDILPDNVRHGFGFAMCVRKNKQFHSRSFFLTEM